MYFEVFYIGIKILFGFRYRSFLEGDELLYAFFWGGRGGESIFDWTIIKSWNLIG